MADEYISREAALKYIKSEQCRTCSDIGLCGNCAVLVAVKLLEKVPAADVAEVRHGRWIHHEDGVFTCSECGNAESNDSYYCRLCAAKMDGGNGA